MQAAGVLWAADMQPPHSLMELQGPVVAALLVQNALGARNADRRQYISEGRYVNPFVQPEELLRRTSKQVGGDRLARAIASVRRRIEPARCEA
jgi:hypothetical protein